MRLKLLTFLAVIALTACGEKNPTPPASSGATPTPKAEVKEVSSLDRGRKLYKRCVTCHTLEEGGKHKVGPNLYAVFGATAGTKEGFKYSSVMAESGLVWTDENLNGYIENPAKFMPKNKMSFVGVRKPEDRDALFEYMRSEMETSE